MALNDIQEFIRAIDDAGELVRVRQPVSIKLEMCEIADRVMKQPGGGKALLFDCLPAAHHLLLAHGRAAIELRRAGAESVGCANNHSPMWPASSSTWDARSPASFAGVRATARDSPPTSPT